MLAQSLHDIGHHHDVEKGTMTAANFSQIEEGERFLRQLYKELLAAYESQSARLGALEAPAYVICYDAEGLPGPV
jgi:hypothetical protein